VLRPQAGAVTYQGLKVSDRVYRRKVAWLPQAVEAVSGLTAREQVAYVGWLKGMSRGEAWEAARGALAQVELSSAEDRKSAELSGGQLRRVGVAQALVHGAELVLLDEPTAGLDPHQRRVFLDMLAGLPAGISVVVSTHDVADLADAADSVVVVNNGQVRYSGPTRGFLDHAAAGTTSGRLAEAAYSQLCGEGL
jgi:ABC-2 type transport system ATP-binding protein